MGIASELRQYETEFDAEFETLQPKANYALHENKWVHSLNGSVHSSFNTRKRKV